jgi:hypothetical protein
MSALLLATAIEMSPLVPTSIVALLATVCPWDQFKLLVLGIVVPVGQHVAYPPFAVVSVAVMFAVTASTLVVGKLLVTFTVIGEAGVTMEPAS